METDFGRLLLFEQMQSNPSQGGEVLIRMPLPDTAVILTKGDVQDSVQTVFNPPVTPDGQTELLRIVTRQTAQVVAVLDTGMLANRPLRFYQPIAPQPGPQVSVSKPVDGAGRPDAANFNTATMRAWLDVLTQRRRQRFAEDPRAVGEWSLTSDGTDGFRFRCDVRLRPDVQPILNKR